MDAIVGVIVSGVLVVIGWGVTHFLNVKREKRAELRKAGKEIVSQVEECQKLAIAYHTAEKRNIELEKQIIMLLERIDVKTSILCSKLNLPDDFWKLKQAITKDNFETSSFIQKDTHDKLIKNIYIQTKKQIKKFYII